MGWWETNKNGNSFIMDTDMVWGDRPADVMDNAIEKIVKIFEDEVGRKPTLDELNAGFRFSMGIFSE